MTVCRRSGSYSIVVVVVLMIPKMQNYLHNPQAHEKGTNY